MHTCLSLPWETAQSECDGDDFDVQALDGPGLDFPSWEQGADQDCAPCRGATPPRRLRSSARPALGRRELRPSGVAVWRPVFDGSVVFDGCVCCNVAEI